MRVNGINDDDDDDDDGVNCLWLHFQKSYFSSLKNT